MQSLASYIIRKGAIHLVSSPLTSVVPFAPLLFSVRGGHNLAAPFMAPYFLMKGLPSPDEQVRWLPVVCGARSTSCPKLLGEGSNRQTDRQAGTFNHAAACLAAIASMTCLCTAVVCLCFLLCYQQLKPAALPCCPPSTRLL